MNRLILKKIKFIAFLVLLQGVVYGQDDWCCCQDILMSAPADCYFDAFTPGDGMGDCNNVCISWGLQINVGPAVPFIYLDEPSCESDAATACFILPVELTTFTAKVLKSAGIQLVWATETELNNEGFVIQRADQDLKWEEVSFEPGFGTTNEIHNYKFIDKNPLPGINYYRLKQMDFDGAYEYSEIISINLNRDRGNISIFPTLAKNVLSLTYEKETEDVPYIQIFDMMGKRVFEASDRVSIINTTDFLPGQYIITVSTNREVWTERFVKVN